MEQWGDIAKIINNINNIVSVDQAKSGNIHSTALIVALIKYLFTKLLIVSILIYAMVFCVKNYNAQMHNSIVNLQKHHALYSTISLLNTAKSDEGNDKIMIQASNAIFSHQETGYANKSSDPPNPNLVTNIVEAATQKLK